MTETFPRLLVATEFSPNAPGGGPAVVRQMLKGWPADKLFWWSCRPADSPSFSQKVAGHRTTPIPAKLYPHRRWVRQKSWMLENLWASWAAHSLQKTLRTIRPAALWIIPHGWSIPPLAKTLSRARQGFHVSIHDYADCGSMAQSFGAAVCHRMLDQADRLYARATTRDAICQAMVDDLFRRTGGLGTIARAGLEQEDFDFLAAPPLPTAGPLRIAYAGTILVEDTFLLLVKALKIIQTKLPRPVALEFFGDHSYRDRPWFEPAWMNEHGNLSAPKLVTALKKCDWGFSPMAMTDNDPRYNRYSLPTKFVSYLGAGLPIITLGHPESSVVKMARAYDVGVCAQTTDVSDLAAQLAPALAEPSPAQKFRSEICRCASAEFDSRRMRATLHANFRTCALLTRRNAAG